MFNSELSIPAKKLHYLTTIEQNETRVGRVYNVKLKLNSCRTELMTIDLKFQMRYQKNHNNLSTSHQVFLLFLAQLLESYLLYLLLGNSSQI